MSFSENNDDLDATLLTVEVELPRVEEQQQTLANSLATLKKARNLSYTLVPINILPPSLLLSVFSVLVDSQHAHQTHLPEYEIQPHPALAISCVSTAWRNLTFNSPSLWSSIFVHPKDQGDFATQMALVRAANALLDIQVSLPKDHTIDWLYYLHPRCEQIRSLDLVLATVDMLRATLSIWPRDSVASSVKSLTVKIMKTSYAIDTAPPKVIPSDMNEHFLQNLATLSLYGGYFDWDSAAFRGLEDLQLVSIAGRPSPTLSQIANMLSSSPQLRALGLGDMRIRSDDGPEPSSVYLDNLCKLSIMSFAEADLCKILPLIRPGSKPLTIHMNYELVQGASTEAYIELFRRSSVESIYFHSRISRNTMADVFSTLPRLRHLYMCRNKYLPSIIRALSAPQTPQAEDSGDTPGNPPTEAANETAPPAASPGQEIPAITSGVPCSLLTTIHFHDCKFKLTPNLSGHIITDQPDLTIKLQQCDPPNFVDVFLQNRMVLVPGQIFFEQLADKEPLDDAPFYGLNRTDTFTLAKRHQTGSTPTGVLTLDDGVLD